MNSEFLPEHILKSLVRAFQRYINESKESTPSQIGTDAQNKWLARTLRDHNGFTVRNVFQDPSTAVVSMGMPYRLDAVATIAGQRVQIELKKTDYSDTTQTKGQLVCLGLGTYGARALYKICGDGKIHVWTREQAEKALADKEGFSILPRPTTFIF